jgi:hypothetical protein
MKHNLAQIGAEILDNNHSHASTIVCLKDFSTGDFKETKNGLYRLNRSCVLVRHRRVISTRSLMLGQNWSRLLRADEAQSMHHPLRLWLQINFPDPLGKL